MVNPAKPVFGKRSAARAAPRPPVVAPTIQPAQAAFFAETRRTLADTEANGPVAVPRSFKAAFLAGLVVGCALVGFTVTGGDALGPLSRIVDLGIDTHAVLLALLVVGLVGGARAAAVTVLVVHSLLAKAEQTGFVAYAAGGALAAGLVGAGMMLVFGHPPAHGWPVEIAAGAGSGFLYRVFAGARPVT